MALVGMGWALVAVLPIVLGQTLESTKAGRPVLKVCVRPLGPVPETATVSARAVATTLLSSADIDTIWQDCPARGDDTTPFHRLTWPAVPRIEVVLALHDAPTPLACAHATRNGAGEGGVVLVFLPCLSAVLAEAHRDQAAHSIPSVAALGLGDLVGVAVAHEVGHVFGLRHSRKGVMRTRLDLEDLIALGQGRLQFESEQAARMRASLKHVGTPSTAGLR